MNDRPNQSSDPIDAEFEPADLPEEQADEKQAKAPKSGGPGWFSFFVVVLIALGSLGFSLWSSGIVTQDSLPRPADPDLASVKEAQSSLEGRMGELSAQLEGMIDRVDGEITRLEGEISDIEAASPDSSEETASPEIEQRLSQLESRLTTLAEAESNDIDPARLAAIEAALEEAASTESGVSQSQLVSLKSEVETLKGELEAVRADQAALLEEVETIRADATAISREAANAMSASLALAAIEATTARGEPFEKEYRKLAGVWPEDGDVSALSSLSQIAIPTLAELKGEFRTLSNTALTRDTEKSAGLGWVGTVFGESVSIRRTDSGSETADRLADAEAALSRDDLRVAVNALEDLPETTKPVFQTWLADARRRARLEQSLEDLRLKLIASGQ